MRVRADVRACGRAHTHSYRGRGLAAERRVGWGSGTCRIAGVWVLRRAWAWANAGRPHHLFALALLGGFPPTSTPPDLRTPRGLAPEAVGRGMGPNKGSYPKIWTTSPWTFFICIFYHSNLSKAQENYWNSSGKNFLSVVVYLSKFRDGIREISFNTFQVFK